MQFELFENKIGSGALKSGVQKACVCTNAKDKAETTDYISIL